MSPDWLAAARRAAAEMAVMLADRPAVADRVRETGERGEGGDQTLEIDAAAEDAVFVELERLHAEGARFRAVSEERGWVDFGGDALVVERDRDAFAEPITTLARAAALVRVDLHEDFSVGRDTPPLADPDAPLGLEDSASELMGSLRAAAPAGLVDLVLNFTPGLVGGLLLGWSALAAVVLGGVTYVTSSGIVAKVLGDLGRLGNRETPVILSILVVEDLAMGCDAACFVGDDVGDIPAFDALDRLADKGLDVVKVGVVDEESAPEVLARAAVLVEGTAGAIAWLRSLL